jgi:hypothetical protein
MSWAAVGALFYCISDAFGNCTEIGSRLESVMKRDQYDNVIGAR